MLHVIDHEAEKEKGQGNTCLFDLSYIGDKTRQTIVGSIHNMYPDAITMEYDLKNQQLPIIRPRNNHNKSYEYHSGTWQH
jgi:hypothetical protein